MVVNLGTGNNRDPLRAGKPTHSGGQPPQSLSIALRVIEREVPQPAPARAAPNREDTYAAESISPMGLALTKTSTSPASIGGRLPTLKIFSPR